MVQSFNNIPFIAERKPKIWLKTSHPVRAAVMYTKGYNGVQICKKKKFETRCTKFLSFYIDMCTGYNVDFVCTYYGKKMLAALNSV